MHLSSGDLAAEPARLGGELAPGCKSCSFDAHGKGQAGSTGTCIVRHGGQTCQGGQLFTYVGQESLVSGVCGDGWRQGCCRPDLRGVVPCVWEVRRTEVQWGDTTCQGLCRGLAHLRGSDLPVAAFPRPLEPCDPASSPSSHIFPPAESWTSEDPLPFPASAASFAQRLRFTCCGSDACPGSASVALCSSQSLAHLQQAGGSAPCRVRLRACVHVCVPRVLACGGPRNRHVPRWPDTSGSSLPQGQPPRGLPDGSVGWGPAWGWVPRGSRCEERFGSHAGALWFACHPDRASCRWGFSACAVCVWPQGCAVGCVPPAGDLGSSSVPRV